MSRVACVFVVAAACSQDERGGHPRQPACLSEAAFVFAEVRIKEEQFRVEHGVYRALGTYTGRALPPDWEALRMDPPMDDARCAYTVASDAKTWTATAQCDAEGMPVRFTTSSAELEVRSDRDEATLVGRSCR